MKRAETAGFRLFQSVPHVNQELTDKALRLCLLTVKTDAKPGQTKEMARDLGYADVGRAQIFRIDLQGKKEEFESPLFLNERRCWLRALA